MTLSCVKGHPLSLTVCLCKTSAVKVKILMWVPDGKVWVGRRFNIRLKTVGQHRLLQVSLGFYQGQGLPQRQWAAGPQHAAAPVVAHVLKTLPYPSPPVFSPGLHTCLVLSIPFFRSARSRPRLVFIGVYSTVVVQYLSGRMYSSCHRSTSSPISRTDPS